jgi:hypothetical protein
MRTLAIVLLLALTPALADDGAASIAAGGLVMRREPRVTMAKEVLKISLKKVEVDYDFRNDTDSDVTTEVAFPIPPYTDDIEVDPKQAGFDDFKLWIEGKAVAFQTDLRAFIGKKDVTAIVNKYNLDIATFAHNDYGATNQPNQISILPPARKQSAYRDGIISKPHSDGLADPNWSVHKRYYWSQTFPAHATIHIRHTYTPTIGYSLVEPDGIIPPATPAARKAESPDRRFNREEFTSLCPSPAAITKLSKFKGYIQPVWVDFILTTANTWERPIEDFTLIVERTNPEQTVSFCWDGPVEKLDVNHFRAHTTNLIPTKELHIGFYSTYKPEF